MRLGVIRVCVMSIVIILVITAEISSQALEVGTISTRTPVLMAQGAGTPEHPQRAEPLSERARVLVGHWRKTIIVFEEPRDEHLVLKADGSVENWVVTASSRSPTTTGTWNVEGKTLNLALVEGEHISQPFTIYEEQLVFPNIPNRRRFWEKIDR